MCYQVEVLELQDDKAIITVGESKFLAYHDTEVNVEEGFDDCWSYSRECHYTKPNGCFSYEATTSIASVELMLDDDVYTVVNLRDEVIAEIKKAIEEAAAIHQALEDEGDNEPDYEYDEVA